MQTEAARSLPYAREKKTSSPERKNKHAREKKKKADRASEIITMRQMREREKASMPERKKNKQKEPGKSF
jgi:hypothetical protein